MELLLFSISANPMKQFASVVVLTEFLVRSRLIPDCAGTVELTVPTTSVPSAPAAPSDLQHIQDQVDT